MPPGFAFPTMWLREQLRMTPKQKCVLDNLESLKQLPEYSHLLKVIESDILLSKQIGRNVGTALMYGFVPADDVVRRLILTATEDGSTLVFSSDTFESQYRTLENACYSDTIPVTTVVPLYGLAAPNEPIHLTTEAEIDALSDEETGRCLDANILPRVFPDTPFVSVEANLKCLRIRAEMKKMVDMSGDDRAQYRPEARAFREKVHDRVDEVLRVLRIFKRGSVSPATFLHHSPHFFLHGRYAWTHSAVRPDVWPQERLQLSISEISEFTQFCKAAERAKTKKFLDNALRRFGYAGDRHRADDKLVDLMISAESLFLSDSGEPKERGEMRYRLAQRAAVFIDHPTYTRKQLQKYFRGAYDARSSIVHGETPKDLHAPEGESLTLPQFTEATEQLMRAALKKAVSIINAEGSLRNWDDLVLGS